MRGHNTNFQYKGTYETLKSREGQEPFMRQYIGIYDKMKGTVTIHKAAHNGYVYQLKQSLFDKKKI